MATAMPEPILPPAGGHAEPPPPTIDDFPLPRALTHRASVAPTLVTQGAEGRLYRTTLLEATGGGGGGSDKTTTWCALKHRPAKPYRHPMLDARLTRARILAEARVLHKCRRDGVPVPALYAVDDAAGTLAMEWIDGAPVRVRVNEWLAARKSRMLEERWQRRRRQEQEEQQEGGKKEEEEGSNIVGEVAVDEEGADVLTGLLRHVGEAVGRLHKAGVVHGDLTTSNMMLRPWERGRAPSNGHAADGEAGSLDGEIIIIDFGLASQGSADEDRAVDLYVLERAFGSTHPKAENVFSVVLDGYRTAFKGAPIVLKKLEDVRMRGRKRSMLG
jgi:TP53 regulating kinase and related kinases